MVRDRALLRSVVLAAMVAAASLCLVTAAGAETGSGDAVAPVGRSAPQDTGLPVTRPVLAPSKLAAAGFLPAAEVPPAAEPSILSTVLLLVGLTLFSAGLVTTAPSGWRRVVTGARSTAAAFQHHGTSVMADG